MRGCPPSQQYIVINVEPSGASKVIENALHDSYLGFLQPLSYQYLVVRSRYTRVTDPAGQGKAREGAGVVGPCRSLSLMSDIPNNHQLRSLSHSREATSPFPYLPARLSRLLWREFEAALNWGEETPGWQETSSTRRSTNMAVPSTAGHRLTKVPWSRLRGTTTPP